MRWCWQGGSLERVRGRSFLLLKDSRFCTRSSRATRELSVALTALPARPVSLGAQPCCPALRIVRRPHITSCLPRLAAMQPSPARVASRFVPVHRCILWRAVPAQLIAAQRLPASRQRVSHSVVTLRIPRHSAQLMFPLFTVLFSSHTNGASPFHSHQLMCSANIGACCFTRCCVTNAQVAMLRDVVREEGIVKMWKGNSAAVVRVVPYLATQVRECLH